MERLSAQGKQLLAQLTLEAMKVLLNKEPRELPDVIARRAVAVATATMKELQSKLEEL
jgi:hypothetical protein